MLSSGQQTVKMSMLEMCWWYWVPKFLFDTYEQVAEGGGFPQFFAASRTVFIPISSTVEDWSRIVRCPDALQPLTLCNCDCKTLTTAVCSGCQQYSISCTQPNVVSQLSPCS